MNSKHFQPNMKNFFHKLDKATDHPAISVIIMGMMLIAIPMTLISFENYFEFIWLILFVGAFLASLNRFINWKIRKATGVGI